MSLTTSYLQRSQNEETRTAGMFSPLVPWQSHGGPMVVPWQICAQLHSIVVQFWPHGDPMVVPLWSHCDPMVVPWQFCASPTVIPWWPCMALLHHQSTEADFPLIKANLLSIWVPPDGTKETSSMGTQGCLGANAPLLPPSTPLCQHKCGLICTRNHFICFQISDKAATHCLFPCCWKIK